MVEVVLACVAALVAWSATAALGVRWQRSSRPFAGLWALAVAAVTIGLTAAVPAVLLGFSPLTFRIFHIGVSFLGPLLLAWGALELAYRSARAKFGNRLIVATLTVVPLVVLILDPVRGSFGNGYPPASSHYDLIPMSVLSAVHGFAALTLVLAAIVGTTRRSGTGRAPGRLPVIGLVALAAILLVVVGRLGLGPLGQLLAIGAVCCVLAGGHLAVDLRDRRDDDIDIPEDDDLDAPDTYGPEDEEEDEVWRSRSERQYAEADRGRVATRASAPRRSRLRGIITIYTLLDGHVESFDSLVAGVVAQVEQREPDTLMFASHAVPRAPLQRIIYAVYRDDLAYEEHEQQPYVVEFAQRRASYVLATNVIELSLTTGTAGESLLDMLAVR